MFRKLSMVAAFAATLAFPTVALAQHHDDHWDEHDFVSCRQILRPARMTMTTTTREYFADIALKHTDRSAPRTRFHQHRKSPCEREPPRHWTRLPERG
jgi:hypothetical protein